MQVWETIQAVVGAAYILFVPGLALSCAFFSRSAVDWIERVALSFALSMAVVPLAAFYLNLVGVRIGALNVVLEVAAITVIGVVIAVLRHGRGSLPSPSIVAAKVAKPLAKPLRRIKRRIQ